MTRVEMPRLPRRPSMIQFIELPDKKARESRRLNAFLLLGIVSFLIGAGFFLARLAMVLMRHSG